MNCFKLCCSCHWFSCSWSLYDCSFVSENFTSLRNRVSIEFKYLLWQSCDLDQFVFSINIFLSTSHPVLLCHLHHGGKREYEVFQWMQVGTKFHARCGVLVNDLKHFYSMLVQAKSLAWSSTVFPNRRFWEVCVYMLCNV